MKKNLLKNNGFQSLLASLLCVVLGMLIGYIVLLFINSAGAGEAIACLVLGVLLVKQLPRIPYFRDRLQSR